MGNLNLKELVGPIDIHTHSGNKDLYNLIQGRLPVEQSVEELSAKAEQGRIAYTVTFPFGTTEYYDIDHFVRKKVLLPSGREQFPYQTANQILLDQNCPNILPFMAIDPKEKVPEQLDFMQKNIGKFYGFKLHTHLTNSTARDLIGNEITQFAISQNLPILIHSGVELSIHPRNIVDLAKAHPQLRVCIAHLAWFDEDSIQAVTKLQNLFIDCAPFLQLWERARLGIIKTGRIELMDSTSSSNSLVNYGRILKEKLMWGTDEPYTQVVKPDKSQSIVFRYRDEITNVKEVAEKSLPIYEAITQTNPRRFLDG